MVDIVTVGGLMASTGVLGWLGNVVLQSMKSREARDLANSEAGLKREMHQDALTFQLLEAARMELAGLREEVHRLRPMELHLVHFEEALLHIEMMLFTPADKRDEVERNARAFLNRMKRARDMAETAAHEARKRTT